MFRLHHSHADCNWEALDFDDPHSSPNLGEGLDHHAWDYDEIHGVDYFP